MALDDADYIRERLGFAGCRIALRVDRDVVAPDGTPVSHETRYFLTCRDPQQVTAHELLKCVRNHWQIENSLFFVKDRWWDEDRHFSARPGLAEMLSALNTCAATVLRVYYPPDQPLRARADRINWHPRLGLGLLGLT